LREDELVHQYTEKIEPYINDTFQQKTIEGYQGVKLRCILPQRDASRDASETALVILGGRTEFIEKYAELFFDLRLLDVSIFSYDHRGQGLSQRLLEDTHKGHVDRFADYVEDLKIFLDEVVGQGYRKVFVLSHSMGGTVTVLFQQRYAGYLDGAILCSPMLGINCFPLSPALTGWIICRAVGSGFGESYIPGGRPFKGTTQFRNNVCTSSKIRFDLNRELTRKNPGIALGAPTNRWLREALLAAETAVASARQLHIPTLLLQSGNDRVVMPDPQRLFCERGNLCELYIIEEARHELLMERDPLRNQAISFITDFILKYDSKAEKGLRRKISCN
jgi:lysophospholipase